MSETKSSTKVFQAITVRAGIPGIFVPSTLRHDVRVSKVQSYTEHAALVVPYPVIAIHALPEELSRHSCAGVRLGSHQPFLDRSDRRRVLPQNPSLTSVLTQVRGEY